MKNMWIQGWVMTQPLFLSGSVFLLGTGPGPGILSYKKGEWIKIYPVNFNKSWNASLKALASLSLKVNDKNRDRLGGKIHAERSDGMKVVLNLKVSDSGTTSIGIRVSSLGKKSFSQHIHRNINLFIQP